MVEFFQKNLVLLITTAGIPLVALFMNIIMRYRRRLPLSTGADLLLFAAVLDAAMISTPGTFKLAVQHPVVENSFNAILAGLIFVGIVLWMLSISWSEQRMHDLYNYVSGEYELKNIFQYGYFILSFLFVAVVVGLHIFVFAVKE